MIVLVLLFASQVYATDDDVCTIACGDSDAYPMIGEEPSGNGNFEESSSTLYLVHCEPSGRDYRFQKHDRCAGTTAWDYLCTSDMQILQSMEADEQFLRGDMSSGGGGSTTTDSLSTISSFSDFESSESESSSEIITDFEEFLEIMNLDVILGEDSDINFGPTDPDTHTDVGGQYAALVTKDCEYACAYGVCLDESPGVEVGYETWGGSQAVSAGCAANSVYGIKSISKKVEAYSMDESLAFDDFDNAECGDSTDGWPNYCNFGENYQSEVSFEDALEGNFDEEWEKAIPGIWKVTCGAEDLRGTKSEDITSFYVPCLSACLNMDNLAPKIKQLKFEQLLPNYVWFTLEATETYVSGLDVSGTHYMTVNIEESGSSVYGQSLLCSDTSCKLYLLLEGVGPWSASVTVYDKEGNYVIKEIMDQE